MILLHEANMQTVGDFTRASINSVRVLQRHGIDFCCGGSVPLTDACRRAGTTPEEISDELQREDELRADREIDWMVAPLPGLVDHIIARHHRPLDAELPRLWKLADKVARVHGPRVPAHLEVKRVYEALVADLQPHMLKEEQALFPWIVQGLGRQTAGPIAVMNHEHEDVGRMLAELRQLTDGYRAPDEACGSWRALWEGLEALEADVKLHIHLENNVLFPRALAS
jgi:regulator of cell morphogenesis and NO signaling